MLRESDIYGEGLFQSCVCCHRDGASFCSVDGEVMRLMIDCFDVWQSGWEESSVIIPLRLSLYGGEIGWRDNKSGVSI